MRVKNTPKNMNAIFKELERTNARNVVLVGSCMIEYALEDAIKSRLRSPASKKEVVDLFSDRGLFGTFSEKILAAYYLRLIGQTIRADLDLIRSMRNECAHNMNLQTFSSSKIADRCKHLSESRKLNALTKTAKGRRQIFIQTVKLISAFLMIRSTRVIHGLAGNEHIQASSYLDQ